MIESQVPSGTNRIEADQAHKLPYYHEFDLSVLQRAIMSIAVIILTIFSIIGNVATLVVAIRSDMISVMVTAVNYLTAFFSQIPQLWYLGPRLCHILPFFKIIGNLVNSATLVGISLDRYLSVRYAMKSSWEPGPKSCFLLAFAVWGVSIAIAVPSYTAYEHYQVNIIRTDKKNSSDPILVTTGFMCGAPKAVNARYYMTLFCILFFPMVVAFIWFNSFLALDIWKRRKGITSSADSSAAEIQKTSRDNNKEGTTDAQAQSTTNVSNTETNTGYKQTRANRERRQLRMFCVVILLIITYMILKLPEWIFLIATFYSRSRSQNPWLMQFAFGIVSMGSSVTNPLLYAFVTQTIEYLQDLYRSCQRLCCILCDRGTRALSSVIILPEPISDIQQISGNGR
ncbi:free fatty acid receptor 4-like isoform X2 [Hermetia illucens]|uniref:free fatty acid receptor 4-like isoform X2 n=1 Tax=Hermetia illucens TaxID=343691 RepID=UPI0018CC3A9B|nr:free fatty acid receptor 4-like isoform X2 [Hermetia illucens]